MNEKITKVLIGVSSAYTQYVESLHSCMSLVCEPGDDILISFDRRGDIARRAFATAILEEDGYSPDDALLLLDADQRQPFDLLKRLRVHNLDMVCAHYYARDAGNIQSMCFALGNPPYHPFDNPPKSGLHEIATTGFGCVLIKKRVLQDMIVRAPEDKNIMETDFLFFDNARKLGYRLWLDANLESEHGATIWLNHKLADRLKR